MTRSLFINNLKLLSISLLYAATTAAQVQHFETPAAKTTAFNPPFADSAFQKSVFVFKATDFTGKPGPGFIKTIFFKFPGHIQSHYCYFSVSMGMISGISNYFPDNLKQVVSPGKRLIQDSGDHVLQLSLEAPVFYNPKEQLAVIIENYGPVYKGYGLAYAASAPASGTGYSSYYGKSGSIMLSGANHLIYFGFDLSAQDSNNTSVDRILLPEKRCISSQPEDIFVQISNLGYRSLNSVQVNWQYDDTLQNPVSFKTILASGNSAAVNLGSKVFSDSRPHRLKVWTSDLNSTRDDDPANDTLITTVTPDITPPYIYLAGKDTITVPLKTDGTAKNYTDAGYKTFDDINAPGQIQVDTSGSFYKTFANGNNPYILGTYTITYAAKDGCGNLSNPATRVIKVKDTIPPYIWLTGDSVISICEGEAYGYHEKGYKFFDNRDSDKDIVIDTISTFPTPSAGIPIGKYYIKYKATDLSGNVAYSHKRTISIVAKGTRGCLNGIDNGQPNDFMIYPNPASDILYIQTNDAVQVTFFIKIIDGQGKTVLNKQAQNTGDIIPTDISFLKPGIYYLETAEGTDHIQKDKLLIIR